MQLDAGTNHCKISIHSSVLGTNMKKKYSRYIHIFRKTATDKFVLLPSQIPFRNEKMKYLNEKGKHVDFQMIDKEYPYI